jgi:hypothetical protein
MDLISRIRYEIEQGVYETPEKLEVVVDRLEPLLAPPARLSDDWGQEIPSQFS